MSEAFKSAPLFNNRVTQSPWSVTLAAWRGVRASEWVFAFTLAPLLQWGEWGGGLGGMVCDTGRVKGGAGLEVGFRVHVSTVTIIYIVGVVIGVGEGAVEYGDGGSRVLS